MSVPKRSHVYPSVRVDAAAMCDLVATRVPAGMSVGDALGVARRRDARLLVGAGGCILRDDLARAAALGLQDLDAAALTRTLPVVDAGVDEGVVRRALAAGAPCVVVRDRRSILGAAGTRRGATPVVALGGRFTRAVRPPVRELLGRVAELAHALGARAFAVGGLVRDVWLEAPVPRRDLDVVVEGDGLGVARQLAVEIDGALTEHARFLTASIEAPGIGTIDVATSRAERYEAPGALPRVTRAGIAQDLGRRDFTINAMAVELASGEFGLLDPYGGREDLARRRLRVLHPLSFVEDPTRMLRGARYATRLGLAFDKTTRRAQALALALTPYPALSGQRLFAELERVVAEARADAALLRMAAGGVLRLLDRGYRLTAATRRRIAQLPGAFAWTRDHGLRVALGELTMVVLLADQTPHVIGAALDRLALGGGASARIRGALETGPALWRALLDAARPSERAHLLRARTQVDLAWLWLEASAAGARPSEVRTIVEWFVGLERSGDTLSASEVIALGVPRGPALARALAELRDGRLDGLVTDRAAEEALIRQWIAKGG